MRSLLRNVIAQPSLAFRFQRMGLHRWRAWDRKNDEWDDAEDYWDKGYDRDRKYPSTVEKAIEDCFKGPSRSWVYQRRVFWRSAIRKGIDEVYVALLILVLPNLKDLNIIAPAQSIVVAKALDYALYMGPYISSVGSLQR